MCGLLGEFCWNSEVEPLSLNLLQHRGPDAQGTWISSDRHCWLGHTRLSILDVSNAGSQPIQSHCGRFILIFNGEIYNHLQLRAGLRFNAWNGHSDSETLVEALAQRGPASIIDFHGMFAFAAYDSLKRQLLLARDRLGIKPLYVLSHAHGIRFASERTALTYGDDLSPDIIANVLSWGHLPTPVSFEPQIGSCQSFPAGTIARVNFDQSIDPVRYWPPQPRPAWTPLPISNYKRCKQFVRDQIVSSVSSHLLSDVPIATFLSSGLDSGILTALASRLSSSQLRSFTVVFPGEAEDEGALARKMAHHCGTEHHEISLTEDEILDAIHSGLSRLDIPTADALNIYLVSQFAAQAGIKVALSGLGADELFGGYPSHRWTAILRLLGYLPCQVRSNILSCINPKLAAKLHDLPSWDIELITLACRRWFSDVDLRSAGVNPVSWPSIPPVRVNSGWARTTWSELFGYTEPMLLRDSDVMTMSFGLELRVPFLDHHVVETALRIPRRFHSHGKSLLRETFADLFPSELLNVPKRGFSLPMNSWLKGPLRGLCDHHLNCLKDSTIINSSWVDQQWTLFEHNRLHWTRIWSLVVLGEFTARKPVI